MLLVSSWKENKAKHENIMVQIQLHTPPYTAFDTLGVKKIVISFQGLANFVQVWEQVKQCMNFVIWIRCN